MHKELLLEWCRGLQKLQIGKDWPGAFRGGILCPACGRIHGRSADAMIAFLCAGELSGDESYFCSAEELFRWSEENVTCGDGSYINDPGNPWKGVTIFSLQNLVLCLEKYRKYLSEEIVQSMLVRIEKSASFYHDHIDTFDTNINYYIAGAAGLAAAGILLGRDDLRKKADELMNQSIACITEDNLIIGEGKCKKTAFTACTPRGCQAIDIGYNVEENIPALLHYGLLTSDQSILEKAEEVMDAHLNFLLPDGAWDNSWGTRNAKWSYWGSRTSDGCQEAYAILPQKRFQMAAGLNLELLGRCTHDGLLTGGPMYHLSGEKTCVHHTICHAKSLAVCLSLGHEIQRQEYVPEVFPDGAKLWNKGTVCTARRGKWYASIAAGDYQYVKGSTPSGGMVTLLHEAEWGPIFAATMTRYKLTEPFNMQYPLHWETECQTMRIETEGGSSVTCMEAELKVKESGGRVWVTVRGKLERKYGYRIEYMLTDRSFRITAITDAPGARLLLPVIASGEEQVAFDECKQAAYIYKDGMRLCINGSGKLFMNRGGALKDGFKRSFNPVGGFIYVQAFIPMQAGEEVSVDFFVEESYESEN